MEPGADEGKIANIPLKVGKPDKKNNTLLIN